MAIDNGFRRNLVKAIMKLAFKNYTEQKDNILGEYGSVFTFRGVDYVRTNYIKPRGGVALPKHRHKDFEPLHEYFKSIDEDYHVLHSFLNSSLLRCKTWGHVKYVIPVEFHETCGIKTSLIAPESNARLELIVNSETMALLKDRLFMDQME